jgi:hypothetical protein
LERSGGLLALDLSFNIWRFKDVAYDITLKALPDSWGSVLERITDKLIDCRAVIAGGAIRDLLLGAETRVKDLDIFVLGPGESTIQNLSGTFGEPPCRRYVDESPETYADGPVWRWPELRLTYDAPLIDLVAMGGFSDVIQLLDKFDIGLVQAAHDGSRYVIHDNFARGIDRRTIQVINASWPDNARTRAARMAQKFPEFTVDLSVLQ